MEITPWIFPLSPALFFLFIESFPPSYKHTVTFILIKKPTYPNLIYLFRYYLYFSLLWKTPTKVNKLDSLSSHSDLTPSNKTFCSQCFIEHEPTKVSSGANAAKFSGWFSVFIWLSATFRIVDQIYSCLKYFLENVASKKPYFPNIPHLQLCFLSFFCFLLFCMTRFCILVYPKFQDSDYAFYLCSLPWWAH